VVLQGALILSAGGRPDHIFGFRMFPRRRPWKFTSGGKPPPAMAARWGGEWSARDASGQLRHFSWRDRVRDPVLASIDVNVFASYGVDAQLLHLARALDDVAEHLDDGGETRRLRAEVVVRRNGRAPESVTLEIGTLESGRRGPR
jgi:hypothetical protein